MSRSFKAGRQFRMLAGIVWLISVSLTAVLFVGEAAVPKLVHQSAFSVIGICVRTSNAKETTSDGVIGKQWQKFFQEGVLQQIPNKVDSSIYAVYSDYASDKNGEYSLTLGARVPDGSAVPAGLVLKTVHAGSYAVVTSDQGPVAKVVVSAWQRVWEMEDKHALGGARAYQTDYEFYDQRAANPQDSQVDLYIGLK
jgi:predicted transcriptional regulator YdeE